MDEPVHPVHRPAIIGVAGGSASGKTTVVERVIASLGADQVTFIQHDSYYRDRSNVPLAERAHINYDHPDSLETSLLVEHLSQLLAGKDVRVPVYDFTSHERTSRTFVAEPRKAVIVEGILILADKALRDLMDIKIFVDTDSDLRLIRRIERDMSARGRPLDSVIEQYLASVRPMHMDFVEPSRRYADVIIPEGGFNNVAVDMLITKIDAIVHRKRPSAAPL